MNLTPQPENNPCSLFANAPRNATARKANLAGHRVEGSTQTARPPRDRPRPHGRGNRRVDGRDGSIHKLPRAPRPCENRKKFDRPRAHMARLPSGARGRNFPDAPEIIRPRGVTLGIKSRRFPTYTAFRIGQAIGNGVALALGPGSLCMKSFNAVKKKAAGVTAQLLAKKFASALLTVKDTQVNLNSLRIFQHFWHTSNKPVFVRVLNH